MFKALMTSVEMGLSSYGTDISKLCLEFLCSLATEVTNQNLRDSQAYSVLALFLKVQEQQNMGSFFSSFVYLNGFDRNLVCVLQACVNTLCQNSSPKFQDPAIQKFRLEF